MKQGKINRILFYVEIGIYTLLAILFAVLGIFCNLSLKFVNIVYITFFILSFGYLFALEFVFKKYDNAVHFKMFNKHYIPTNQKRETGYSRKGLPSVILLWIAYIMFVYILKRLNFLTWYVFLIGACFVFALNSFFIRKKCLLSMLFLKNKNDCCKNCGINCWDYAIFSSALIFAPKLSTAATILNIVIISISICILVVWELKYHKYPYRFYPETNATLKCANCLKQCKYKETNKTK